MEKQLFPPVVLVDGCRGLFHPFIHITVSLGVLPFFLVSHSPRSTQQDQSHQAHPCQPRSLGMASGMAEGRPPRSRGYTEVGGDAGKSQSSSQALTPFPPKLKLLGY